MRLDLVKTQQNKNLKNLGSRINLKGKVISSEIADEDLNKIETPHLGNDNTAFDGSKRMVIVHQSESGTTNTIRSKPINMKRQLIIRR